jgi:predicted nuclease of predicted toxin-antitoxin system
MKFKLDENLPVELVEDLQQLGHQTDTVHSENLAAARREQRILLTMDKGIADVRRYPPAEYSGIVLFRCNQSGRQSLLEFIRPNLLRILNFDLPGHLLVVSENGIRYR